MADVQQNAVPGRAEAGEQPAKPLRMSYEEFLQWADEDTLAEWVDGEVVMYSPASLRHQEITIFLSNVLGVYVEQKGLGRVLTGPFQMKLERSGREPDLLFVASEHLDRLRDLYLDGPADLAIEVTSPTSISRDRGDKYVEYETAGVREYWLIDPDRQQAEFYQLGDDGRYRLAALDEEGRYHSKVLPGFWLKPAWLWQRPLPKVLEVLRLLGVV